MYPPKKLLIQQNLLSISWFITNLFLIIYMFIAVTFGMATSDIDSDRFLYVILFGFISPIFLILFLNPLFLKWDRRIENKLDWILIDEKKKLH